MHKKTTPHSVKYMIDCRLNNMFPQPNFNSHCPIMLTQSH